MLVITEVQKKSGLENQSATDAPEYAKITTIDMLADQPVRIQFIPVNKVVAMYTEDDL